MSGAATLMTGQPERSFVKRKHAPTSRLGAIDTGVIVYECSGLMFWFTRKKFAGSYLAFKATRRS
jgi:hypothetical protein